jgi:pimeloyl-ACP methyl ester carboxylesterase
MRSKDADRSGITLRDCVDAVVEVIDSSASGGKVAVVGHSAGCGIGYAAIDARPESVARAVYIGGFPTGEGLALAGGFSVKDGGIPLPDWSDFDEADLVDLDEEGRRVFRARAIPSPAHLTSDAQRLADDRRYDVPVTVVATEFTSEMLRRWIEEGMAPVQEFPKIRDLEYIDLPTGHWPQFTRPDELSQIILRRLG